MKMLVRAKNIQVFAWRKGKKKVLKARMITPTVTCWHRETFSTSSTIQATRGCLPKILQPNPSRRGCRVFFNSENNKELLTTSSTKTGEKRKFNRRFSSSSVLCFQTHASSANHDVDTAQNYQKAESENLIYLLSSSYRRRRRVNNPCGLRHAQFT